MTLNKRIWILINDRCYCTSSYNEAIEFASMFHAQIRDISVAGRKERIWILINDRCYCTSSYKEAIEFASMFRAQIRDISVAGRKEKLNYCGEL